MEGIYHRTYRSHLPPFLSPLPSPHHSYTAYLVQVPPNVTAGQTFTVQLPPLTSSTPSTPAAAAAAAGGSGASTAQSPASPFERRAPNGTSSRLGRQSSITRAMQRKRVCPCTPGDLFFSSFFFFFSFSSPYPYVQRYAHMYVYSRTQSLFWNYVYMLVRLRVRLQWFHAQRVRQSSRSWTCLSRSFQTGIGE